MQRASLLLVCALLLGAGCKQSNTQPAANNGSATPEISTASSSASPLQPGAPPSAQSATAVKPKVDACAMLTTKEIEAVQGEAVKETKLSGQAGGGLQISQCFFTLPTFSNSISLLVAQKGDGLDAKDPKEFWRETFGRAGNEGNERERERERESKARDKDKKETKRGEEEEEGNPPQKVSGVGEDAYWVGSRVGGALYVLKSNAYVRISIGGAGDQTSKINKSKTLAQKIIARL